MRAPAHVENVTRTGSDGFILLLQYSANGRLLQENVKYESARTVPSTIEVRYQRNNPSVVEILGQPTRASITAGILAAIAVVFGVFLFLQAIVILKEGVAPLVSPQMTGTCQRTRTAWIAYLPAAEVVGAGCSGRIDGDGHGSDADGDFGHIVNAIAFPCSPGQLHREDPQVSGGYA